MRSAVSSLYDWAMPKQPNSSSPVVSDSDWNAYFEMTHVDPAEYDYEGI